MWTNLNQNWSTNTKTDQHGYVTIVCRPITGFARTMLYQNADQVPVSARMLAHDAGLTTERAHMEMDLHQDTFYDVRIPMTFVPTHRPSLKWRPVILKKLRIG